MPSDFNAQVEEVLAAKETTPVNQPATAVGMSLCVTVLSHNCPFVFSHRHRTVPLFFKAHICHAPATIFCTPVNPTTLTGVSLCVVVLSPRRPFALLHRHFTVASVMSAQLDTD